MTNPKPANLHIFPEADEFLALLESFGIIQKGHFEYKKTAPDGRHYHGEYFINYRLLTTEQEKALVPYYHRAIEHWFGEKNNLIIVGVAMGSLLLPKVIQMKLFETRGIEYAYAEKRNGILGIFDEQAKKLEGKHLLFIEDVCNNATSLGQLNTALANAKEILGITGYSVLYGVHRGHAFAPEPANEIYAMGMLYAPAYAPDEMPEQLKDVPLKLYKK